jgi:hypothetical protein
MPDTLAVALISAKDTKPLLLTELDSLTFNGVEKQLIVNDKLSDNPIFFVLSIVNERINAFLHKTVGSIIEFKVT